MITEDYVRKIFKGLEQGDGASFFEHATSRAYWTADQIALFAQWQNEGYQP